MIVKESLKEYFERGGRIQCGLVMSSSLIDKLEIYGFVENDPIISTSQNNPYGGINPVCMDGTNRIVCSGFIYQKKIFTDGYYIFPVYHTIVREYVTHELPLKLIYVQALKNNNLYQKIRSRRVSSITPSNLKKHNMPENIVCKNGMACYKTDLKTILCINNPGLDEAISGVCRSVLALCRYIDEGTGNVHFTLLDFSDIFTGKEIDLNDSQQVRYDPCEAVF